MCGTTQSKEEAEEVAFFFPEWGKWWKDIRARVIKQHRIDWGEPYNDKKIVIPKKADRKMPMCRDCISKETLFPTYHFMMEQETNAIDLDEITVKLNENERNTE